MLRRPAATLVALLLFSVLLSGCLARRRVISRKTPTATGSQTLLVTTREPLLALLARRYEAIRDFSATVDMTPALGSTEKNRVTEYKDVRGYILFRKPSDIRIIGLYPVVRGKAFDMVSDGTSFRLHIPRDNRYLVGLNTIEKPSEKKIENLRPQHFLDALIVRPPDEGDAVLFENFTDEDNAFYVLQLVRISPNGQLEIKRSIWFDRMGLRIARQILFDDDGNILTDARYSQWKIFDNVVFPAHIEINRPRDEYAVVIDVVKMDVNQGVMDDKFLLEQPEGTTLQVIGRAPEGVSATPAVPASKKRP